MTMMPSGLAAVAAKETSMVSPDILVERALKRLCEQARESYRGPMARARKERAECLRIYAGPYAENAVSHPMNMMHQMATSIVANLTSSDPVPEVTPKRTYALRGFADMLAAHMSERIREMKFRDIERDVLIDALMCFGVFKVGIESAGYSLEYFGENFDPGRTYICRISPDDFIIDCSARHRDEASFQGHRYRTTMDRLASVLTPQEMGSIPKWTDRTSTDMQGENVMLGRSRTDEFMDFRDLLEMYIPPGVLSRSALVVTLPGDIENLVMVESGGRCKPVAIREYDGPEGGDYSVLGFNQIPDSVLFAAPMGMMRDLGEMVGELARHNIEADRRHKRIILAEEDGGNDEEVEEIRDSQDCDIVRVRRVGGYNAVEMGGASERANQSLSLNMSYFSRMSGTDLMSGNPLMRGKSGDVTATEVEEVSGRLGVVLDSLERVFYEHTDETFSKFAFYEMKNPQLNVQLALESMGIQIPVVLDADTVSENDLADYNLQIRRGSMRRMPEAEKSKRLTEWAASIPLLGVQLFQAFGPGFNIKGYLKATSRGLLTPAELEEIFMDPQGSLENMAMMQTLMQINGQQEAAGGAGMETPDRAPGIPGSSAMPNSFQTGNRSGNFDKNQITDRTKQGMRQPSPA